MPVKKGNEEVSTDERLQRCFARFTVPLYQEQRDRVLPHVTTVQLIAQYRNPHDPWHAAKSVARSLGGDVESVDEPSAIVHLELEPGELEALENGVPVVRDLLLPESRPLSAHTRQEQCFSAIHESGFLNFAALNRRDRYDELLRRTKTRTKFTKLLYHNFEFSPDTVEPVPPDSDSSTQIAQLLYKLGSSYLCYFISADGGIDGKFMPVHRALSSVVGLGSASVLSLIPGKLCYFEGEEPNERYILSI